jgi:hypothetical protein
MTREKCPECKEGFLYNKMDGKFTLKICYACGYYWNDSKGYSELSKRLFKEYFPTQTKWMPSADFLQGDEQRRTRRGLDSTMATVACQLPWIALKPLPDTACSRPRPELAD